MLPLLIITWRTIRNGRMSSFNYNLIRNKEQNDRVSSFNPYLIYRPAIKTQRRSDPSSS